MSDQPTSGEVVDTRGSACPVPIIELAKVVAALPVGAFVQLLSDDPSAKVDVPVWCRMQRHSLVSTEATDNGWRFVVEKTH